jgi:hypothetical protein
MWNPAARASMAGRSPIMEAAVNAGQMLDSIVRVLREPRKYLRRGVGLFAHYVARGDFKGLIRESNLFRRR